MRFLVKLANNNYWNSQKLVQSTLKTIWQYNSGPTKYSYSLTQYNHSQELIQRKYWQENNWQEKNGTWKNMSIETLLIGANRPPQKTINKRKKGTKEPPLQTIIINNMEQQRKVLLDNSKQKSIS